MALLIDRLPLAALRGIEMQGEPAEIIEERRANCAAGFHFYGPENGEGERKCFHCPKTVNADEFFVEAVMVLADKVSK
jgi:hypothetical protein